MQNQIRTGGIHLASDRTVAFIDADYTEFEPSTFKGYVVRIGVGGEPSGHFGSIDAAAEFAREQGAQRVSLMSSCDNLESDRKHFA